MDQLISTITCGLLPKQERRSQHQATASNTPTLVKDDAWASRWTLEDKAPAKSIYDSETDSLFTTPDEDKDDRLAFKPVSLPVDIEYLISQLTLEEKIALTSARDLWSTAQVPRLGIPPLKYTDGPNGARGVSFGSQEEGRMTSACFPAAVSMAASFNLDGVVEMAKALAGECKAKGANVLLGPTVCMHRDPRGGRNFEAFSEDPFLAGEMAVAYINSLQSEGISASLKHYCLNEQETDRFKVNVDVDERTLREIYLRPFEIAVKRSQPWTLMTGFTTYAGAHLSSHNFLIEKVLRGQWGFKGLILSDFAATYSVAPALMTGLDLELPGPPVQRTLENVSQALATGQVTMEALNQRVRTVLKLIERVGKFESPVTPDERAVDDPANRELIRRISADGMVLLKNDNDALPIKLGDGNVKSIALLGLAKSYLGHGGGSAAVNSIRKITPYQAFEEATRGTSIELRYAEGAHTIRSLPIMAKEVYDEHGKPGFTLRTQGKLSTGENIGVASYLSNIGAVTTSEATISCVYKPTVSGNHYIGLATTGNTTVHINNDVVFAVKDSSVSIVDMIMENGKEEKRQYAFTAGKEYYIRIECHLNEDKLTGLAAFAKGVLAVAVGFMEEAKHDVELLGPAVEVASSADVAIVFTGHSEAWESEGIDRDAISLPSHGSLDALVSAVASVNSNTIVVNSTGAAVTMPWIDNVAAVLQSWLPGQEAGYAIADILLGAVSPGGKLPCTFPKSLELTPTYTNFPGDLERHTVKYEEGVFVGYRYYDERPEAVLFPFGHGLSYSVFDMSCVRLSKDILDGAADRGLIVSIDVANTGAMAASEVVQVYVGALNPSIARPKKELAGFRKVKLAPGRCQTVTVTLDARAISYWDVSKGLWSVDAGDYRIFAGNSSVNVAHTIDFEVESAFELSP